MATETVRQSSLKHRVLLLVALTAVRPKPERNLRPLLLGRQVVGLGADAGLH